MLPQSICLPRHLSGDRIVDSLMMIKVIRRQFGQGERVGMFMVRYKVGLFRECMRGRQMRGRRVRSERFYIYHLQVVHARREEKVVLFSVRGEW